MNMGKEDIQKTLIQYYGMIDDYFSTSQVHKIEIEEIESRCDYFENVLEYLTINKLDRISINADKLHFGGK